MFKKFLLLAVVCLISLFFVTPSLAHQPRLVAGTRTEILNPEISQAFYGQLSGSPAFYEIKSERPFNFYFGLLVPDIPGQEKNFSARLVIKEEGEKTGRIIYVLNGLKFDWQPYFEKFAGDAYYKGPDWKRKLDKGNYTITVWNPRNDGKYVLVVGEKESFSLGEIFNTICLLPKLKKDFFGKSPLTSFFNLIGLFLLVFILVLIGLVFGIIFLIKKFKQGKFRFMIF